MKGKQQGVCVGCGERKGDRDRNAGWYELAPRGRSFDVMLFCPPCSGALLVGLDERMGTGKPKFSLRAVEVKDLDRIALLLNSAEYATNDAARLAGHLVTKLMDMTRGDS